MAPIRSNRILVIDDDDLTRESIAAYLLDSQFEVFEASRGDQGVEMFKTYQPDLVISDLKMPVLDGISVIEALHDLDPELSVIVISGASDMQDVVRALRSGAFDYLIKPIRDLHVLEHSVYKGLERSRLFRENCAYRAKLEATNIELAQNLRLLKQDQQAAKVVQLTFFPKSDQRLLGLEFSHQVMPSLYLSGDFVNYFAIDDTRLGFYMADVSGHGASSALVTLVLKNFTDRLQRRANQGLDQVVFKPAQTLSAVNQELLSIGVGKHLAMIYGVIDTRQCTLVYATGAHFPPPILVSQDEAVYLKGRGLPVGLFPQAKYEEHEITYEDPFSLFLCTDGVLEIIPSPTLEEKQKKLLEKIAEGYHNLPSLLKALGSKEFVNIPDDIAFMSVRSSAINEGKPKVEASLG